MRIYFQDIANLEELRKEYKKLIFKHHPDRGGDHEIAKQINNEYDLVFEELKQQSEPEDKFHFEDLDDDFKEVLNKLLSFDELEIEICGSWLWVSGNTQPHKEEF